MMQELLEIALRSSAVCGVALVVSVIGRRWSAALLHRILLAAVVVSCLMPLRRDFAPDTVLRFSIFSEPPEEQPRPESSDDPALIDEVVAMESAVPDRLVRTEFPFVLAVLITGSSCVLIRALVGAWLVAGICRRARRIDCCDLGCGRWPVCWSAEVSVPAVAGWLRPIILLPKGAAAWDTDKLAMAVCHEETHIRRGDLLFHPLVVVFRALYWWNPLTYLLLRALRRERERACDESVLASGYSAAAYADLLLEVARAHRVMPLLSMATPPIGQRVRDVLAERRRASVGERLIGRVGVFFLAGLWGAICLVSLRKPASEAVPFALFGAVPGSGGGNAQIVVRATLIEVSEEAYRRDSVLFDRAVSATDRQQIERWLGDLARRSGVNVVSAPSVTVRPGTDAVVQMVREFRYPTEFVPTASGLTPIRFSTTDLGLKLPFHASVGDSGLQIQGTLNLRTLAGFTASERGVFTPAFQSSEAHFLRVLPDGGVCGMWIPGAHNLSGQSERLQAVMNRLSRPGGNPVSTDGLYEPVPPVRLAMFLSVRLVGGLPAPAARSRNIIRWLERFPVEEFSVRQATLAEALEKLQALLVTAPSADRIAWHLKDETGLRTRKDIQLRSATVMDVLYAVRNAFGCDFRVAGGAITFVGPAAAIPPAPGDLPVGAPVPNKPGFVTSPHAPDQGYVDLRGFPPGTEVKCPYTGKLFRVP